MATTIEILVDKIWKARGTDRLLFRKALADHISINGYVGFLGEVALTTDTEALRYLWSIGLDKREQEIVLARLKELKG